MSCVLIVHYDPNLLLLLQDYIEYRGVTAISASTCQTGWEHYQFHQPNVIITDAYMPDEDIFAFLVKVKKDNSSVRLIMLSALFNRNIKERIEAIEFGVDAYLGRPFEPEELMARVRYYIKEARKKSRKKRR